jgi:hypothetical protein
MTQSVDEITASARAARAKGQEIAAGCYLNKAAECRNILTESRPTHATPLTTRRAVIDASCRIANYVYNAIKCVASAQHSAAIACREAKTPLAKSLAKDANKSVTIAARVALETAIRVYSTCAEAVEDAEAAEKWYIEHCND